jgi:hypothetical protein
MELESFLRLVMTVLAGTFAWWLIDRIKWFAALQPDTKRLVSYAFSAAIAIIAYLGLIAIGSEPAPGGVVSWVTQLWLVGTSSFGMSTLLNTMALKKYRTA